MKDYEEVIEGLKQGPLYLITAVKGPYMGKKLILQEKAEDRLDPGMELFWEQVKREIVLDECPKLWEIGEHTVFAERLVHEPELIICGGGHVSLELSTLADFLEYPYTVIDERIEFAGRDRFVNARECICEPFSQVFADRSFSSNAYYVIVTRGHAYDLACLEQILTRPSGYVGMIGSRAKVRKTMDVLLEKGFDPEALSRVHAPIGLDIGGETPREIAVSIAAQLIQVKNQDKPASYIDSSMRTMLVQRRPMVLAKIIAKRGSAPRGVGSQMLVDESGILCGTIGGGKIEYEAVKRAKQLANTGKCMVESYCLDTESAASLGMWCGGEVDVYFEAGQ